jgi:predicted metal-binding membrane protein
MRRSFAVNRFQWGLVVALFALAGVGWWWTTDAMRGMDNGPWTGLGSFGWFIVVWVVMMAAMMFPSVAPTVALYARMARRRAPAAPLVFTAGYVVTWTAAGLLAYGVFDALRSLLGPELSWENGGRWLAGGTLVVAAAYELTPLKDVCLGKCRSPLGFLLGSWRDGLRGAFQMGARHGAWCVGCCWALMAALFALGVMSLAWMAFVAALIALEKTVPARRSVTYAAAGLLLLLGVVLVAAPDAIPGLTVPGSGAMEDMGSPGAMPMR